MNSIQKVILVIIVFFLGVFAGQNYNFGPLAHIQNSIPLLNSSSSSAHPEMTLFWKVWDTIDAKYYDKKKVDHGKMIDGAIAGMVSAVGDPYTVYLTPEQNKNFNDNLSGKYSGVGIQLGFTNQKMVVIAPLDGSPAERAGVKPNDSFVKIADKLADTLTLPEAVSLIRGEPGTSIKLSLIHEGQTKSYDLDLMRETITVKTVILKELPGSTAYIKLTQFGDNTLSEWDDVVNQVVAKGYSKVVLDLRNNPGGRFDVAINIASEFVDKNLVVAKQEWYDGKKQDYPSRGGGKLTKTPLIVLVNKGSASASEILSGALRDNKRAKLVGEQTFGKGIVQEVEQFDNNGGLHITSSRWLTPSGVWVDETKGLTPDVEVKAEPKDTDVPVSVAFDKDPVVLKALESF